MIDLELPVSPERRAARFLSHPPRGGTGFSNEQAGCHFTGVYRVLRAGLEAWLGVQITILSGLFVVVVASMGVISHGPDWPEL